MKPLNKFLLTPDKFMPKLHLRQQGFIYRACGLFTKHRKRIQKFIEISDLNYTHKTKLDKACFTQDAVYSDCKDLKILNTVDIKKAYRVLRINFDKKTGSEEM